MKDYYKILNLNKDCSQEDIKKNYKFLAMKHHPDKGGDSEIFKDISEAYQILIDKDKKFNYDNNINLNSFNSLNKIDPDDLFRAFFNRDNNLFNYRDSLNKKNTNINLNNLFTNLSINNTNNINNSINETRNIYIVGNNKLEKIVRNNNGKKTEIIVETNLSTGEIKQKIRQIN
jgi:DnaJ-class molecular chaperone